MMIKMLCYVNVKKMMMSMLSSMMWLTVGRGFLYSSCLLLQSMLSYWPHSEHSFHHIFQFVGEFSSRNFFGCVRSSFIGRREREGRPRSWCSEETLNPQNRIQKMLHKWIKCSPVISSNMVKSGYCDQFKIAQLCSEGHVLVLVLKHNRHISLKL